MVSDMKVRQQVGAPTLTKVHPHPDLSFNSLHLSHLLHGGHHLEKDTVLASLILTWKQ